MPTVQGELEGALQQLCGEQVRTVGAGRTDAGVHAKGQVVSFETASRLAAKDFVGGLNYYLPDDIAVVAAREVGADFSARRHARSRVYRYTILARGTPSPLWRRFAWQVKGPLAVEAMSEACGLLPGRRDFAAFCGPPGRRSTVRRLWRAEVRREGELVVLEMEAESFLPQQVRRTVGALVEMGRGKMTPAAFEGLLRRGSAGQASFAAPAQGLCLMAVKYDRDRLDFGTDR